MIYFKTSVLLFLVSYQWLLIHMIGDFQSFFNQKTSARFVFCSGFLYVCALYNHITHKI